MIMVVEDGSLRGGRCGSTPTKERTTERQTEESEVVVVVTVGADSLADYNHH
jgi:hypothetical protein